MLEKGLIMTIKIPLQQVAIAGAKHVHELAKFIMQLLYFIQDHCAKKLLPWIDGLLDASESNFNQILENRYLALT